jgi:transcription antitermination factor NusG
MPWFVIRTHSRRELKVHGELQEIGFNSMVPLQHRIVRPSRHSKRRELRSQPLMFGYLFLEADELPWQEIKDVSGIHGFIARDGDPYALRPADIERLLALSSVMAQDDDPDRPLRPGDNARVINGPYAGKVIRVIDIVGPSAKWVTELLGSKRTISIRLTNLERA